MRLLLTNARLVLEPGKGIAEGWLLVENGLIADLGPASRKYPGDVNAVDCSGDFLAPGLVDIHCHGALGRDAMEASPEAFRTILAYHARQGTTTAVLTTVAAPLSGMIGVLRAAEQWSDRGDVARLAGIHLEGPWFSPKRRGAHAEEMIHAPLDGEIDALLGHASVIRRVTLAPELPLAGEAVRRLVAAGIAVSAGHSDATEEEARAGFASGITQTTHLHNAMSSLRKTSPERPGLAEAALATPGVLCELIADGIHVTADLLAEAYRCKGWEGMALVSDATAGAGLGKDATFRLGSLECHVGEGATWTGEGKNRRLAGSTEPLFRGIRAMVESAGVPLDEAVAIASLVPARSLGLAVSIGSLEAGKAADLIRFSPDWILRGVWREGVSLDGG